MALKLVANYSKRLGLPGYSSHQFSVSVEVELINTDNVTGEASRLYQTLQNAVDREMQSTGFVPTGEYGTDTQGRAEQPAVHRPPANGGVRNKQWKASEKQRDLVLKLVENSGIDIELVESISEEMFGHCDLIDELLSRYGKRQKREAAPTAKFNGRVAR
jgi:hypothetical protein